MFVVGVSYCVLIVFFPFCDARYKRYLGDIGKDLLEENQSLFLWSVRRSPGILCWNTGKLLHWACIYIRLSWFTCFTYKEHKWLKWFLPLRLWFLKTFFQKYKYIILTPYMEVLDGKNSFQTIDGKNMVYPKPLFKVPGWLWYAELSVWKWRNGEWWCLWKIADRKSVV